MKHCQQCNLDFPLSFRFCGSCGGGLIESVECEVCGEMVDSKWKFCTACGHGFASAESFVPEQTPHFVSESFVQDTSAPKFSAELPRPAPQASAGESVREWYMAPELLEETNETTVSSSRQPEIVATTGRERPSVYIRSPDSLNNGGTSRNGRDVPTLTMLSAYGQHEPVVATQATPRYPILLALTLTVFFAVVGFAAWYLWSHRAVVAAVHQEQTGAAGNELSPPLAGKTPAERAMAADTATDEWKSLRERRIATQPFERSNIIALLEAAEKKYANDYRFPYERAKLSIKGITSHHEAFNALADAAEKAIDGDKAQEMLDNLLTDQNGDFWKLARGHHEWHELIEALTNKDQHHLSDLRH
jgi:hypothetical protein